jgi:predicted RNase H-like HicB family nuclease
LTLDYWEDDSWYVGRLREVPGCFSQGETLAELEKNIREVYRLLKKDDDFPMPDKVMTKRVRLAA